MKKIILGLTPLLLVGCSLFGAEEDVAIIPTVDSFVIESGDTGLILKSSIDENFENILSTHPIIDAGIEEGILTFTEDIDGVPMTRAVNLEAFAKFLNKE